MLKTIKLDIVNKSGEWAHGLFGCFVNCEIALIAYFAPCATFGLTAEALGKSCLAYGCLYNIPFVGCFFGVKQRGEIRRLRDINGSAFEDLCLLLWCGYCTLVQEAQEVDDIKREQRIGSPATVVIIQPGQQGNPTHSSEAQVNQGYVQPSGQNEVPPAYEYTPPAYEDTPPAYEDIDRK